MGDLDGWVGDFGCGTGRLAIGAALTGCDRVLCIDISCRDLFDARKYSEILGVRRYIDFLCWDLRKRLNRDLDTVVMNPPFGIYRRGIDLEFLKTAMATSKTIYSLFYFNIRSLRLIERIALEYGFKMSILGKYQMEVPAIYPTHRRRIYRIPVLLARFTYR
jgi:putative methylase